MQSTFLILWMRNARLSACTWSRKRIQTHTELFDVQTYVIEMVNVLYIALVTVPISTDSLYLAILLIDAISVLLLVLCSLPEKRMFTLYFIGFAVFVVPSFYFQFFFFIFSSFCSLQLKFSYIFYDFSLPLPLISSLSGIHLIHNVHSGYKISKSHHTKKYDDDGIVKHPLILLCLAQTYTHTFAYILVYERWTDNIRTWHGIFVFARKNSISNNWINRLTSQMEQNRMFDKNGHFSSTQVFILHVLFDDQSLQSGKERKKTINCPKKLLKLLGGG